MDAAACRRSGMESLAENLVDGFVTPIFWYCLAGLPGIVTFKVVSTLDSVVGYKTARYLRFGWCGARLDDLMNLLPARLTWLLIAVGAALVPRRLQHGSAHHGLAPARRRAGAERRLERGGSRRGAAAAPGRADLAGRPPGNRPVDRPSFRPPPREPARIAGRRGGRCW